jgi:hypothetical protein
MKIELVLQVRSSCCSLDQAQIGLFYTNILDWHAINRKGFMSTFKVLGRNDKA